MITYAEPAFSYQDKPFKYIGVYPVIKDTAAFVKELKANCHLEVDNINDKTDKIDQFSKFKIYGSTKTYYLIELNWQAGSMATFPWKYQVIFDEKGNLLKVLNGIRSEFINVFPNKSPLLLSVVSTARGNGWHELYRIKKGKLINTIKYPENFCVRTYDAHEDMTVNSPEELKLVVTDFNHDGYNDLQFSGDMVLIMGVTKDNMWVDQITTENITHTYSVKHPFKTIPIKIVFRYNPKTELFSPIENYNKYCTENLYKIIYK